MAIDDGGGILTAWISQPTKEQGKRVMSRRFDSKGIPWGPPEIVSSLNLADCDYPSAAMDPQGRSVIAWRAENAADDGWQLLFQRFEPDGLPANEPVALTVQNCNRFTRPSITMDEGGNVILGWSSLCPVDEKWKLFAHAFDEKGNPVGEQTVLAEKVNEGCCLFAAGPGIFGWAKEDGRTVMAARRFETGSKAFGREMILGEIQKDNVAMPRIHSSDNGQYVQAWAAHDNAKDLWKVFVAKMDDEGKCRPLQEINRAI